MKTPGGSVLRFSAGLGRVSADVLAVDPGVVIPLSRAVVCGEDHVYDGRRFAVCPNCTGQDRLLLEDLLSHRLRFAY
ncbi:MAG TPA: hypothetical protein VKJ00_06075 [Thermoanaerobaculia bacterium]|nr:hypothetical protein [Thermoanaerobaculia bacterium]